MFVKMKMQGKKALPIPAPNISRIVIFIPLNKRKVKPHL